MDTKVTTADLAAHLDEYLDRVRERGERITIERDGESVAVLSPATHSRVTTLGELVTLLHALPRPDDRFADDLEAIQAEQQPIGPPPWD
jgi:prevent-host-death family protein